MVDTAANIWRDFVTDGLPSTGTNAPNKAKIREWGTWVETQASQIAPLSARVVVTEDDIANLESLVTTGIKWKTNVRVAATSNVNTSNAIEDGDTLNGVTLATGDRVLLPFQSTASQIGVYVVPASGAASRATDLDTGPELLGAGVFVQEGTTYAGTRWVCSNTTAPNVGSDAIGFVLFDDPTTVAAQGLALAQDAVRRQNIALKRTAPTIWGLGDSRFNSANADHSASNGLQMTKTGYSPFYWAWRLFPYWNCDTWWDDSWNAITELAGANQGRSSRSADDAANDTYSGSPQPWRAPIMAKPGDILWLYLGLNDIWLHNAVVNDILADKRAIITEALSKGMKVIVSVTPPVTTAHANFGVGSGNRAKLVALQAGDLAFATEFEGYPVFVHDTRAVLSLSGDDVGNPAMFYDGIHHGDLGGYTEAKDLIAKVLSRIVPKVDYLPDWKLDNAARNYLFAGTSGTLAGSNNTGSLPDNWRGQWVNGGSTLSTVASISTDAAGEKHVELAMTSSGGGTDGRYRFSLPEYVIPSYILEQWAVGIVKVRLTAGAAWRYVSLQVQYRNAAGSSSHGYTEGQPHNDGISATTFPATLPNEAIELTLMTAPYLVPSDRERLAFIVDIVAQGAAGNPGTVTISRPQILKIADPRQFWGFP